MKVRAVRAEVRAGDILAGAQFADAYSLVVGDTVLDARTAAERMTARSPRWVEALMALRDGLVAPFGIRTSRQEGMRAADRVGLFPVVSQTPERLVAGFDDKHLDFRLVVDVAASGNNRRVTATTVVRTHNRLGRVYLAAVLPFHRLIVPVMLRQIGA